MQKYGGANFIMEQSRVQKKINYLAKPPPPSENLRTEEGFFCSTIFPFKMYQDPSQVSPSPEVSS